MRFPLHNLAYACLAVSLQAEDAWSAWMARLQEQAGPDAPWLLVLRPQDARGAWWNQDDRVRRLLATREFQVRTLTEAQGRDLSLQKEWKQEPRWLLLSPRGEKAAEGRDRIGGERLLEALRGLGCVPRWERREAFLQQHPEHGPARAEALQEALTLLNLRVAALPGGATGVEARLRALPPDLALREQLAGVAKEAAEALQALSRVPGWWAQATSPLRRWNLRTGQWLPQVLAGSLDRMQEEVRAELERDPADETLWTVWTALSRRSAAEVQTLLESLVPAPGQAWPPEAPLGPVAESFASRGDWAGLLRAMDALKRAGATVPADRESWDRARYALAIVEMQRARALSRLGRWEESAGAVGEARFLAGQRWRGFLPGLLRRGIPEAQGTRREVFAPFLDDEPLPDPPMPAARRRLRLLRLGAPAWSAAWTGLPLGPELAPWSPAELEIGVAPPELERSLRERHGWQGPCWALVAGDEVLASGAEPPAARELAQRLEGLAPSRLQRLDQFLERHPDHRAARRRRLDLLRARMPNRHLEERLVEDARLLRARIQGDETWTPDPGLWQWAAQQVLPTLEADLERWPDRAEGWRAWIAWARLHARTPSALEFARRLPQWDLDPAWSSQLPPEVHKAVAEELRSRGRFEEQREWFQAAWEGLDRRPARRGPGGRVPPWLANQRRPLREAIVDPLREALQVLRRDAELLALDREVAAWLGEGER